MRHLLSLFPPFSFSVGPTPGNSVCVSYSASDDSPDLKNQKVHKCSQTQICRHNIPNANMYAMSDVLKHSRQRVSYSDAEKCFSCHTVCHSNGFKRDFKGLGNTELSTKEGLGRQNKERVELCMSTYRKEELGYICKREITGMQKKLLVSIYFGFEKYLFITKGAAFGWFV